MVLWGWNKRQWDYTVDGRDNWKKYWSDKTKDNEQNAVDWQTLKSDW